MIGNEILYLIWAIVVTVIVVGLLAIIVMMRRKHEEIVEEIEKEGEVDRKRTLALGRGTIRGELNQILGTYSMLNDYEHIAFLTSVAKQFPLDLIGVNDNGIDFIEIKSLKTPLSPSDKKIKELIDNKKVEYKVIEGNLPKSFNIQERPEK
ncbi:MAG: hypothetical protein E6L00_00880 [Thaumarchaeota archaeon]|nr:MAG: hypothetical protein E6L00_00880 [Nitrososphaerota archaeon]